MTQDFDGSQRAVGGQPGVGIGVGEEQLYSQGFPKGAVLYRFGSQASVTRDLPGWFIADGTQPPCIIDGVSYTPNLTQRVIMGADGSAGFNVGDVGGSAAHVHPFTHEAAHVITQPVFDAPAAHVITQPVFDAPAAHVITQPVFGNHAALATHQHQVPFGKGNAGGAGGEIYVAAPTAFGGPSASALSAQSTYPPTANATANINLMHTSLVSAGTPDAHSRTTDVALTNNHAAPNRSTNVALTNNHAAPNRSVDVALTNNAPHAGGSVDAATGANKYQPYMAVWPLIKVYG